MVYEVAKSQTRWSNWAHVHTQTHTHITESLFCTPETNTTLKITLQFKYKKSQGFPSSPVVKTELPLQRMQVWSLAGELYPPCWCLHNMAKKENTNTRPHPPEKDFTSAYKKCSWDKVNVTSAWLTLVYRKNTGEIQIGCAWKWEAGSVSTQKGILTGGVYEYVGAESGFDSDMLTGRWDVHACLNPSVWLLIIPEHNKLTRHLFQLQWNRATASSGGKQTKLNPVVPWGSRQPWTWMSSDGCTSSWHWYPGSWNREKEINWITAQVALPPCWAAERDAEESVFRNSAESLRR